MTTEYSLEDLAARRGVSTRTIRFYQSQRLLPKPKRQGRDALYDEGHEERLRLIAELRDRGLSLGTIRDLLGKQTRSSLSVKEWLGLDETLRGPWSDDRPALFDRDELAPLLGQRGPGVVSDLERAGYLVRQADGANWLAPSLSLLESALRLHDAGVDIELSGRARDLLRRRLARAADDVVELFVARAGSGFAGAGSAEEVQGALSVVRPVAREAAGVILAQEIERALRRIAEAGPDAVSRPKRRRSA